MIDAELRRAVLGSFPPGTSLAVVAAAEKAYAPLLEARADSATSLVALTGGTISALGSVQHVLLEGIDDVEEPAVLLREIHAGAPAARLFVLVANAAYLRALAAFFDGTPLAQGHPLVEAELEPLISAAGWRIVAINPVPDESIPGPESLPFELASPSICFKIADPAMLQRARIRAFIVVADRA
ncbi:MAG: hypothetical protein JO349_00045 [Candidatus Eremiobacteraeota bacterium]|nr:hypothetical protein [Candidatus Eremiobacteraeota bacterium]